MVELNGDKSPTILFLFDTNEYCSVIKYHLRKDMYHFLAAQEINEAITILGKNEIDIILIDCSGTDDTNVSIIKTLKKDDIAPHIPVVSIIDNGLRSSVTSAIESGADDYFSLPLIEEEIRFKIRKNLESRSFLTENAYNILKKSEEKYRLISEKSNAMICETDTQGRFLYVNTAFRRIMGYEPDDLIGKTAFDIGDPDERGKGVKALEKAENINDTQQNIWNFRDKNDKWHYCNCYSYTYIDPQGKKRINTISFDTTEQRIAEQNLKESEEKFRLLVEYAPDAIFISSHGKILYLNNAASRLMGAGSQEEMIGQSIIERIHPDYRSMVKERIKLTDDERLPAPNVEEKYLTLDGKVIDVEVSAAPFVFRNENCSIIFARDITKRKQAEAALLESEKKYREIIEFLPLGVFELDGSGNILYANSKLREYSGYTKEDMMLTTFNLREMVESKDLESVKEIFMGLLSGEIDSTNNEYTGIRKNRTRYPIQVMSMPIKKGNKIIGVRGLIIDITDKVRLENEIQKSQKLESLGILAGGIAHDFNNILTGIRSYVSLVKYLLDPTKDSELHQYLDETDKAIIRAESLTKQLLTFSKGGAPVKKISMITDIIAESANFITRGSKSKCFFDFAENLWMAEVDGEQVSQVIQNIVINAIQAMPAGGKIEIRASNYDNSVFGNPLLKTFEKYIRIDIADHGSGISDQDIKNIFDPYFTTKKTGTGLGLAISHSIVRSHYGLIEVASEINKGTCFSIYLPAAPNRANAARKTESHDLKLANIKNILFMDDDEQIRESAKMIFKNLNLNGDFTKNGEQAIEYAKKAKERNTRYDVAILDLTVQNGMGGKEAIIKLRELDPGIIAIVSSGYSNDHVLSNYKAYGFQAMIAKPYNVNSLIQAIRKALE